MSNDDLEFVWREIKRIGVCMVASERDGALAALPAVSAPDRAANVIWVNAPDGDAGLCKERRRVCLAYVDNVRSVFVSVSGRVEDTADGPTAATRRLAVQPDFAEFWQAPQNEFESALDALTGSVSLSGAGGVGHRIEM